MAKLEWIQLVKDQVLDNPNRSMSASFDGAKVIFNAERGKHDKRRKPGLDILAQLLRSDVELPRELRDWLAELFAESSETKHRLTLGYRGPGQPAGNWSMEAGAFVYELWKAKLVYGEIIEQTMDKFGMSEPSARRAYKATFKALGISSKRPKGKRVKGKRAKSKSDKK